jgi:FkbM family methyltransferase
VPRSPEEHVGYTRNEFLVHSPYYNEVYKILSDNKIRSYIDIGANTGEVCNILFETVSTLKEAYLIEPEEKNFKFLEKNVKYENCKFLNCAIGYNYKNANLISHSANVGSFELVEGNENNKSNVIVKTLEELNIPEVDFIKIDIEGGEFNLIENSTYLKTAKFLEIEIHKNYENQDVFMEYLWKHLPEYKVKVVERPHARCFLSLNSLDDECKHVDSL